MEDKRTKKKEIDIFSLFKKEKLIRFEDDSNFVEILMVKLTQGQRKRIFDVYDDKLDEYRDFYAKKEKKNRKNDVFLRRFVKRDIIRGIIEFERPEREKIVDLMPSFNELNKEEKEKAITKELSNWTKQRTDFFNKLDDRELRRILVDYIIEAQAIVETNNFLNTLCLSNMCLHPKTKEPVFKSADEVLRINDKKILDWLLKELSEFRNIEMSEKREISTSGHFLSCGQSQNA